MYKFVNIDMQNFIGFRLLVLLLLVFALAACASAPQPPSATSDPPPEPPAAPTDPPPAPNDDAGDEGDDTRGLSDAPEPEDDPDRAASESRTERRGPDAVRRAQLAERDPLAALLATMSRKQKVGQLIMPGMVFAADGRPLTVMDERLRRMMTEVQPGGFILFGQNIRDAEQLRSLIRDLQSTARIPLIIATDQEGGLVTRVRPGPGMPVTELPAARTVGQTGDPSLAFELGRVIGRELAALGITMNFAPVADVLTNPGNAVIGTRAYGRDPETVGRLVAATVRGMQREGVSAVVKHFPGHGDTADDSHTAAVTLPHDLERLLAVELPPFRRAVDAGVDGVLTGHIAVPNVSGTSLPATLDATLLTGLLRERLGFPGVIVTDSLTMGAISGRYGEREIAVRALAAGVDLLLRPPRPELTRDLLLEALQSGDLSERQVDEAVRRVLELKVRRGLLVVGAEGLRPVPAAQLVPDEPLAERVEHRAIVDEIRSRGGGQP